LMWKRFC